jgi:hypothetical protein
MKWTKQCKLMIIESKMNISMTAILALKVVALSNASAAEKLFEP